MDGIYSLADRLVFIPTGQHPTGTLTGFYYIDGKLVSPGTYHPSASADQAE